MSFGILQTFIKRAKALGIIEKISDFETVLRQTQARDDIYEQVELEIIEEERPPMIEIEQYREKFNKELD
jgi:glucosyl-3-phosphoglycerate synthase